MWSHQSCINRLEFYKSNIKRNQRGPLVWWYIAMCNGGRSLRQRRLIFKAKIHRNQGMGVAGWIIHVTYSWRIHLYKNVCNKSHWKLPRLAWHHSRRHTRVCLTYILGFMLFYSYFLSTLYPATHLGMWCVWSSRPAPTTSRQRSLFVVWP